MNSFTNSKEFNESFKSFSKFYRNCRDFGKKRKSSEAAKCFARLKVVDQLEILFSIAFIMFYKSFTKKFQEVLRTQFNKFKI